VEKHLRISRKLFEKHNFYNKKIFIDIGASDGLYSFYFAKRIIPFFHSNPILEAFHLCKK